MPFTVIWNTIPLKQLRHFYHYIHKEKQQPLNAEKFLIAITTFADKLALNPYGYPKLKKKPLNKLEYRAANFKKRYNIVYRVDEGKKLIIITNLFHNSQNPDKLELKGS